MPVDNSDYLMKYIDIYVQYIYICLFIYTHIYLYMLSNSQICQLAKSPAWIVSDDFPSTAQLPGYKYIKGWLHHHFSWTLGTVFCWENHTHFLAQFFISFKDVRGKTRKTSKEPVDLKRIILEKHREINELLEEVNSRNITKDRKEEINILLVDLYEQLHETEQALVLISS